MSVSFYMNKDLEKSLAKTIQGLIAGAEKMQNFSIFRGFPQASFKKTVKKKPPPWFEMQS